VTLPKARLVGFEPRAPAVTPVPVTAIAKFEFEASEAMVTVPLAFPADCGAKLKVKLVLCCEFKVNGGVIPVI